MQRPSPRTGDDVTSPTAARLLASGRDCDIFEYAPGLVLRRSRRGRRMDQEARVMEYARQQGYPVPAVERISDDGTELVIQRIDGPSLVGAIERRPWTVRQLGALLADLHRRLHDIPAPDFVPAGPVGDGDRLLHLDLHPLNVIIGPAGPVVIDWTDAARGDPALDVGMAWLLMAAGEVPAAAWKRPLTAWARASLVSSFLAGAGVSSALTHLPDLVKWKSADPNMTAVEIARMRRVLDGARAASVSGSRTA
jgi:aminoglycoside phosphotransferase (APT) family kinase protein